MDGKVQLKSTMSCKIANKPSTLRNTDIATHSALRPGLRKLEPPENGLLNMDDTFLQNINLDELEQEADSFVCRNTIKPVNHDFVKKSKWANLSLSTSSQKDVKTKQPVGASDVKDSNISKSSKTLNNKEKSVVKNKSEIDDKVLHEEMKKFQKQIGNKMLKDCNNVSDKANNNTKSNLEEELDLFKMCNIDMVSEVEIPNNCSVKQILSTEESSCSNFKSFLEDIKLNEIAGILQSPPLFSSSDSAVPKTESSHINSQLKTNNESEEFCKQFWTHGLDKKLSTQNSSQTDFTQFFKCSQVTKQLDAIFHEEKNQYKNNKLKELPQVNVNKIPHTAADQNFQKIIEGNFKIPSRDNDNRTNCKRKSLENTNSSQKIPKINFNISKNKENEFVKPTVENEYPKMDDLSLSLQSSQFRNEMSQMFQNLERSICQLGPNQDPLQQSIVGNTNWSDDSFTTEALFNGIAQNIEASNVDNWLKKALQKNAIKSTEPQALTNHTVINTEPAFKKMGQFYGLPTKVKELIKLYKGIDQLYDWQDECLNLPAVKERKNLIYSLPTSGGKTLVAEILILQELICRKRNAIFVMPYVAIVQEKVWALSPFAVALDFLIEEYAAGKGTYPPKKRRHKRSVYIATTEKALGIINSLVETGRLDELGLVVVDELHLIGEDQRGPTLETLLTKLMYINDGIQIVGMSATIGNLSEIKQFLNAEVYIRNFRPVELTEYVKCENQIAKINWNGDTENILELNRTLDFGYSAKLAEIDPDRLGGLVMETVPNGSCLVFCPSKKSCENVTMLLCRVVYRTLKNHKTQDKINLLDALKNEAGTLCDILKESIPYGIAYHHSGLTAEERRLIEEAYRTGILCVICCTSTLAAGVNLPAKRVIIRKPYIAKDFINLSRYKQMVGRAGRAGLGELGESILICSREEVKKVRDLLISPMDQTLSKMHHCDCKQLRYLFLSCIGLGVANTRNQLEKVAMMTLLAVQQEKLEVNIKEIARKVISHLFILGAVTTSEESNKNSKTPSTSTSDISFCLNSSDQIKPKDSDNLQDGSDKIPNKKLKITNTTKLVVTKLGSAAIKGNLDLNKAHMLYEDLAEAQKSLVLIDCLHLLYLVTPFSLVEQIKPDRNQYHNIMMQLTEREKRTATVLNITDSLAVRMLSNQAIKSVAERVLNKFYMSLMLYDLWNEVSVIDVSEKYQINRGIVQNLMTQASTFATNVVSFCEQLEELWPFAHLLRGMSQRLAHCCCRELVPLMELPAVKQSRARQLFNAGFKNLQSIAKADPTDLIQSIEFMSHKVANQLIAAAKMLLLEKVETLREEAEDVLDGVEDTKPIFNQTFLMK